MPSLLVLTLLSTFKLQIYSSLMVDNLDLEELRLDVMPYSLCRSLTVRKSAVTHSSTFSYGHGKSQQGNLIGYFNESI